MDKLEKIPTKEEIQKEELRDYLWCNFSSGEKTYEFTQAELENLIFEYLPNFYSLTNNKD